ncbi:hypothetical protein [Streptosporangium roseum]|uniref:hypothetical protein n=1 Tax=Streptosporangium roseum TaxID=2001 RepID=UPI003CCB082F
MHLICDTYGTHKTPAIKAWPARHRRFHMRFTPTGSSWIDLVERWSGFLADQLIRRGAHKSVQRLRVERRKSCGVRGGFISAAVNRFMTSVVAELRGRADEITSVLNTLGCTRRRRCAAPPPRRCPVLPVPSRSTLASSGDSFMWC